MHKQSDASSPRKFYFFTASLYKMVLMSFFTFGFYELYWFYKNWMLIRQRTGSNFSPFWRTVLSPFWAYNCFRNIKISAAEHKIVETLPAAMLATMYAASICLSYLIPVPYAGWIVWVLVSVFSIVPVNNLAVKINQARGPNFHNNDAFTFLNWACMGMSGVLIMVNIGYDLLGHPSVRCAMMQRSPVIVMIYDFMQRTGSSAELTNKKITCSLHEQTEEQNTKGSFSLQVKKKWSVSLQNIALEEVAWSPDGSTLVASAPLNENYFLIMWDKLGRKLFSTTEIPTGHISNGECPLLLVQGTQYILCRPMHNFQDDRRQRPVIDVRRVGTGKIVKEIADDLPDGYITHFIISADQKLVALVITDHDTAIVAVYDTTTWHRIRTVRARFEVTSLVFFHDGVRLAIGTRSGKIAIYDFAAGRFVKFIPAYDDSFSDIAIRSMVVNPTDELLLIKATTANAAHAHIAAPVQVRRVSDGQRTTSFDPGSLDIDTMVWDPKGRYVAFAENDEDKLILWRLSENSDYMEISFSGAITSLVIAPDGNSLAVTANQVAPDINAGSINIKGSVSVFDIQ